MNARRFGRFTFDLTTRALSAGGRPVPLQARTAALLAILVLRAPELVSRDELFAALWPDGFVEDGNLPQQIYHLRKALDRDPDVQIETVRGQGYRLVAPEPSPAPAQASARATLLRALGVAAVALLAVVAAVAVPSSTVRGKEAALPNAAATAHRLGVYYFQRRNHKGWIRAMHEFGRTVELAPNAPQGYSGRALMEVTTASVAAQMSRDPSPFVYAGAEQDARKALSLGEDADAHAILGFISLRRDVNLPVAIGQFKRAVELDPDDSVAHEWYGITLLYDGQLAASRAEFEEAIRTDPTCGMNLLWLATAQFYQGDYAAARRNVEHIFALDPYDEERFNGMALLSQAAEMQGDLRGAVSYAEKLARETDDNCYRDATMFRLARLPGAAAARVPHVKSVRCPGASFNDTLAMVTPALELGRDDEVMRVLRAERARAPFEIRFTLLYDPRLNHLRTRPDYAATLLASSR